ncbi:MAG: hypothetical protein Q8P15_02085 [Nanoarchaeota archaeon]|nr:hypothetical protein [Nanoarchaeota archaeon]
MENTYILRLGSLNEILAGEGEEVETVEDLYCSSRNAPLILVPKFVGVYQESPNEEGMEILNQIESFMMNVMDLMNFNEKDKVQPNLISIIYDQDTISRDIIRSSLPENFTSRISIFNYRNMPIFEGKSFLDYGKIEKLLELKEEKTFKDFIKNINSLRNSYGLTKREECFYEAIHKKLRTLL